MKNLFYKLDDQHNPIPVELDEYMVWLSSVSAVKHVGDTRIGDVRVSTVFLSLDHNLSIGPPLLFETMVFGGCLDLCEERYSTWADAEAGHARWIEAVKAGIAPSTTERNHG